MTYINQFSFKKCPQVSLRLAALASTFYLFTSCTQSSDVSKSHNVFGTDNREIITTLDYPFSAVGRLETGCTATLIGRRLVLTAAHCVYDSTLNKVRPELKSFIPFGGTSGEPVDAIAIKHVWFGSLTPEQDRGKDWAILLLDTAVDSSRQGMAIKTVDFASSLPFTGNLAGFSSDLSSGMRLGVHRNCQIRKVNGERLLNDCDSKSGISGGPFYVVNGSVASIVAIAVSEYRQGAADSVTVANYSDDYANVAISAQAFFGVSQSLSSVDQGGTTLPSLPNVQGMPNPNYTGGSTPPPPPPDFAHRAQQVKDTAAALNNTADTMRSIGSTVHNPELLQYGQLLQSYFHSIQVNVSRYQQGSITATEAQQGIATNMADLNDPADSIVDAFRRCGRTCSQGHEQLLALFLQQLNTLRTLTASVVP